MMAFKHSTPPPAPRGATYTTSDRDERASRRSFRLTGKETQGLRDLWTGVGLVLGLRSPHGALENRLLLAPPRDVDSPLLEELERLSALSSRARDGWVSEGALLRVVTTETSDRKPRGVKGEFRRALQRLVRDGAVERRAVELPNVPARTVVNPKTNEVEPLRTNAEQLTIEDWTGFEVRRADAAPKLALVRSTREERWRRQDEALEREHQLMHGSESRPTQSYDPPEDARTSAANKAFNALSKLSERHAEVLRIVVGQHHPSDESEVEAVRGLVGGDDARARVAIEEACRAYRVALGS